MGILGYAIVGLIIYSVVSGSFKLLKLLAKVACVAILLWVAYGRIIDAAMQSNFITMLLG